MYTFIQFHTSSYRQAAMDKYKHSCHYHMIYYTYLKMQYAENQYIFTKDTL